MGLVRYVFAFKKKEKLEQVEKLFSQGKGGVYKKVMSGFNRLNFNLPFISFNILQHHRTTSLLLHPPPKIFKEIRKKCGFLSTQEAYEAMLSDTSILQVHKEFLCTQWAFNWHFGTMTYLFTIFFFQRSTIQICKIATSYLKKKQNKEMYTYFCTWGYTTWDKMPNLLIYLSVSGPKLVFK